MKGKWRALAQPIAGVVLILLFILGIALLTMPESCAMPVHSEGLATLTPVPTAAATGAGLVAPATPVPVATKPAPGVVALAHEAFAACGSSGNADWSSTSGTFEVVCRCTLDMERDGIVFISAGASLSARNCEYEAELRLCIDDAAGHPAVERAVDAYCDSRNGMDVAVDMSVLKHVRAGSHTFYLLCRRTSGTGTVLLHDPTLAVLAFGTTQ